jgi:hypothetical protein
MTTILARWRANEYGVPISLACHNHAQLGFVILDDVTAEIKGHAVDRAGELERRLVKGRHRGTRIGADRNTTSQAQAQWRGVRELGLPDDE